MAALREMGLAAALLAATGGAAIATWSYFSARRRKEAEETAEPDPLLGPQGGQEDPAPRVEEGRASLAIEEPAIPAQQVGEEECSALIAAIALRHEEDGPPSPQEPPVTREMRATHTAQLPPQVKASASKQVVVLGLDGSGKTSVLNSMAANKGHIVTTPTGGVNAMCVNDGNSKMEFLEIGGSEQLRPYWKMYLSKAFAVIFVVDAADHSRLPLAKRHLHQLIQQDAVLPLIVLANKQDLENAYHITEIHDALELSEICENRKLFLIGTHVTNSDCEISTGIQDAKEYLAQLFSEDSV
ncbi:ADP-ribosylation factor-like protein 9 [Gastrophryne carolinensis]